MIKPGMKLRIINKEEKVIALYAKSLVTLSKWEGGATSLTLSPYRTSIQTPSVTTGVLCLQPRKRVGQGMIDLWVDMIDRGGLSDVITSARLYGTVYIVNQRDLQKAR